MKIGLVTPYVYPLPGGVNDHVGHLYEALRSRGHDVRILTASHGLQRSSEGDVIRIGNACTLGPAAFVHYGATLGDHVVIDADSFLMKGEVLASHTRWRGNPARMVGGSAARDMTADRVTGDIAPARALAAE